jgi:fumarate hydratase subunit beta
MRLDLPLSEAQVRDFKIGQTVSLTGVVHTARDEAHVRMLEYIHDGRPLPFDLRGGAIYHCGPIMERDGRSWRVVAAGPTTSARMNALEPEVVVCTGVRAIIGKGGMSRPTIDAMARQGCVYLAFTGGAAVVAAKGIKAVKAVHWLDLGMAEAVWELQLQDFGPLVVAMDCEGRSLYEDVEKKVAREMESLKRCL